MKHKPYSEIINLPEELEEYKKLCKGKSKRFTYYLEWKQYILGLFEKLDTPNKKENFKHYLIVNRRVNKNINSYFVALMIFAFSTLLNHIDIIYNIISLVIIVLITLFQIMYEHDKNDKEYWFYNDLIEIIEEMQNEEADICPTPRQVTKKR